MDLRHEFVLLARQEKANISGLCRRFNISRPTAYKWIARYEADGKAGLVDRSRRPKHSPRRTSATVEQAVVAVRETHPTWSGYKIRHVLLRRIKQGRCELQAEHVPAASTCHQILKRHGLIRNEEAQRHKPWQRFERARPNELWQMDFKGDFLCGDGTRCYPLTLLDDHSRFSLGIKACEKPTTGAVRAHLTNAFTHYGRPEAMLMDNGPPWGSSVRDSANNPYHTRLSAWLMRLGIQVLFSSPGHPQTQGKLERFHRSLKAEVLRFQEFADVRQCQEAFTPWRYTYNLERPHEALDMQVPATCYQPSSRTMPDQLPPLEYGPGDTVRKVDRDGYISYHNEKYKIGRAFTGNPVALRPTTTEEEMEIYYCHQQVKTINLTQPNMTH